MLSILQPQNRENVPDDVLRLLSNLNATTGNSNQKTNAGYEAPDTWTMESGSIINSIS